MRVDEKSSDAELVRQTLAGDNGAFSLLHARYEVRLFSYAFKKMGNQEDAQDIVQETFIEVFQYLRKLDRPDKICRLDVRHSISTHCSDGIESATNGLSVFRSRNVLMKRRRLRSLQRVGPSSRRGTSRNHRPAKRA